MKKIFIMMLMAVAATASFAQNNPKIDKEIKATKDYNAGLELLNSKLPELSDEEKAKAYTELYKLAKPAFDKSVEAAQTGKPTDDKAIMTSIDLAMKCQQFGAKDAAKFIAEVTPFRTILINAANGAEDNADKLAYSLCYINSAVSGDQFVGLASFFAAYSYYQTNDFKNAAKYAKGAFGDERVSEQAEQVYRVSLERSMETRQDTLTYINALKELDADKYFVNICNLYTDMGEKELVQKMVEEAIAANPNNKFAFFMRGTTKNENKEFDAAIKDFEKVIEIDPTFIYGYFNLALCYGNKADDINLNKADKNGRLFGKDLEDCSSAYMKAIENLEKVRELDPNHETISNWPMQLRMYYNRVGQKDKADEISKLLGDM